MVVVIHGSLMIAGKKRMFPETVVNRSCQNLQELFKV